MVSLPGKRRFSTPTHSESMTLKSQKGSHLRQQWQHRELPSALTEGFRLTLQSRLSDLVELSGSDDGPPIRAVIVSICPARASGFSVICWNCLVFQTRSDVTFIFLMAGIRQTAFMSLYVVLSVYRCSRRHRRSERKFDDLGMAIRNCRVDFGVEIELPVEALRPRGDEGLAEDSSSPGQDPLPKSGWRANSAWQANLS